MMPLVISEVVHASHDGCSSDGRKTPASTAFIACVSRVIVM